MRSGTAPHGTHKPPVEIRRLLIYFVDPGCCAQLLALVPGTGIEELSLYNVDVSESLASQLERVLGTNQLDTLRITTRWRTADWEMEAVPIIRVFDAIAFKQRRLRRLYWGSRFNIREVLSRVRGHFLASLLSPESSHALEDLRPSFILCEGVDPERHSSGGHSIWRLLGIPTLRSFLVDERDVYAIDEEDVQPTALHDVLLRRAQMGHPHLRTMTVVCSSFVRSASPSSLGAPCDYIHYVCEEMSPETDVDWSLESDFGRG